MALKMGPPSMGPGSMDDPYAAIRTLPNPVATPSYRPLNADEWLLVPGAEGYERQAPAGAVQIPDAEGGMTWGMKAGETYGAPEFFANLGSTGFGSKYNDINMLGDGRMSVTYQQPGAHKYDTMLGIYGQDPQTGQWTLQNDPMQAKTRQVSTGESMFRDPLEMFGKEFVLPAAAMYTGAYLLQPYAANLTAALEGAGAVEAGIGTLQSPLTSMPPLEQVAPIPPSGIEQVAMPTLPKLPAIGPGLGGSKLPDWMPKLIRDNPQVTRGIVSAIGGLAGGADGGGGGGGGQPETYGIPKQWTSGLTMSFQPRPRKPVLNYNVPSNGLSMGAGRFLGG